LCDYKVRLQQIKVLSILKGFRGLHWFSKFKFRLNKNLSSELLSHK
jgi:hypothetical protein